MMEACWRREVMNSPTAMVRASMMSGAKTATLQGESSGSARGADGWAQGSCAGSMSQRRGWQMGRKAAPPLCGYCWRSGRFAPRQSAPNGALQRRHLALCSSSRGSTHQEGMVLELRGNEILASHTTVSTGSPGTASERSQGGCSPPIPGASQFQGRLRRCCQG